MNKTLPIIVISIVLCVAFLYSNTNISYADEQTHSDQYSGSVVTPCVSTDTNYVFRTITIGLNISLDGLYNDSTIKPSDYAEIFNPVWIRENSSDEYYSLEFDDPALNTISVSAARLTNGTHGFPFSNIPTNGVFSREIHKNYCSTNDVLEISLVHTCEMNQVIDSQPSCTENGQGHSTCAVCGHNSDSYVIPASHNWDSEYTIDKAATCTEDGVKSIHCKSCDETMNETVIPASHEWEDLYTIDEKATCTQNGIKSIHCSRCNASKCETIIPASGHERPLVHVETKEPTCTQDGNDEYWQCSKCGNCFSDENADTPLEENNWIIRAPGHTWELYTEDAGLLKDGKKYVECTVCHEIEVREILPGWAKSYVKGLKVTAGTKSFTVKWKKRTKKIQKKFNGYEVRYATKSDMRDAKTKTAKRTSKSKTVKGLKKNKRYYVQVRTYTQKDGLFFYSKWSAKKTIKTK